MQIERAIQAALAEDLSWGDITSDPLLLESQEGRGSLQAKKPGVVAGMEVVSRVFHLLDPQLETEIIFPDGSRVEPGTVVGQVRGRVVSILKGERTALNFLCRLSGIATLTARYVEAVKGLACIILDTRKTAPGLRFLDKYAVRMGGGKNHRFHLGDGAMIKDNHWAALRQQGISLREAIARILSQAHPLLKVEVEVKSLAEAQETLEAGADILMLDNLSLEEMRQAVALARGRALVEASGGITLETVRQVAETGVNFISVGALTHSPPALDFSLELEF